MIACKWVGAVLDSSGYASSTRSYLEGLIDSSEVDLTVKVVSFEPQKTTHGEQQTKISPFINKPLEHKIQVTHLTPENYPREMGGNGIYNIAYTVWETDKLPEKWAQLCNSMDEIWVPSSWNKEIFAANGVTKPIYVVPHIIKTSENKEVKDLAENFIKDGQEPFLFYSIFQWIERKAPLVLLKAYLTEFEPYENVCLAIKSYRLDTSISQQNIIKKDIANLKQALNLGEYPPIRFFGQLLPAEYMNGLHSRGDCFVLPHRAEGFGICMADAMARGKPVISSRYSGNLEFMNDDNSFLIDCQETPVCNMIFSKYHGKMTWAEPSISHLKELMRYVYENQDEANKLGEQGKKDIEQNLNPQKISSLIINRLKEIEAKL